MATVVTSSAPASSAAPGLEPRWTALGTIADAPANRPLLLDDPDSLWCVLEGHLDIFAVTVSDGHETGFRTFFWDAQPGQVVPGAAVLPGTDLGLLAVGCGKTRLLQLRRAALEAVALDLEGRRDLARLLDCALEGMARAIISRTQPRIEHELAPAASLALDSDGRVGAAETCWIRLVQGAASFTDDPALALLAESPPQPLAPGMWLGVAAGTSLEAVSTEQVLESGQAWAGLRLAVARLTGWARNRIEAETADESERLDAQSAADSRMFQQGLRSLASLLDNEKQEQLPAGDADPLLEACLALGRHAGITFRAPPSWETAARDRLAAICRASRVRYRQVALRGEWWRAEAGPLLAFRDGSGAPVTILPTRAGAYELADPATPSRVPLSEETARGLQPFAYSFYRPAPERSLDGNDLLQVALHGLRADLGRVLILALLSGLLSLAVPLATSRFFSVVIPESQIRDVWVLIGALVAVAAGTALFDLTRAFFLIRVECRTSDVLQATVVDRLLSLPVPFFRDYAVGDLARRAQSINQVRDMVSGAATQSILGGAIAIMNLLLLFYFDRRLAIVAVGLLAFAAAFTYYFGRRTLVLERERQDLQGRIAGLVFQMVGGISKLRVAAAERRAFAVWARQFSHQQRIDYRAGLNQAAVTTLNATLPILSTLVLFAVTGYLMKGGPAIPAGTFIAFIAAFGAFFASGRQLSTTLVSLMAIGPILERARPILATPPEVDGDRPDPGELTGTIEGAHLDFRYRADGPLILADVSFKVEPGEFVAFVGPSGSGKSTILRLLLAFEQPENGKIFYDHQELDQLDVTAVRSQIGAVLQSSQLMSGSVFKNIVGMAPLTEDDAWEAAAAAGLADDIRDMPMGMQTFISEGGSTLSGGQRQRLLIARALVRKPRIIFFDEATSALDNRTQELVSHSLEATRATRLVIAHRLSTIRHADRIYVIERGRVVQEGSFDALLAQGGLFGQLVARQIA